MTSHPLKSLEEEEEEQEEEKEEGKRCQTYHTERLEIQFHEADFRQTLSLHLFPETQVAVSFHQAQHTILFSAI